jgi:protein-tyrosine-phosphatase
MNVESAGLQKGPYQGTIAKKVREALYSLNQAYYLEEDERSKPVTQKMVEWADRIIYMSPVHYKQLLKKFPAHRRKFSPLGAYAEPPVIRIPDLPFLKGDDYMKAMRVIESGVLNLSKLEKGK